MLCGKRKTDQPLEMDLVPSSSSKANAPEEGRGGGETKSSVRPITQTSLYRCFGQHIGRNTLFQNELLSAKISCSPTFADIWFQSKRKKSCFVCTHPKRRQDLDLSGNSIDFLLARDLAQKLCKKWPQCQNEKVICSNLQTAQVAIQWSQNIGARELARI